MSFTKFHERLARDTDPDEIARSVTESLQPSIDDISDTVKLSDAKLSAIEKGVGETVTTLRSADFAALPGNIALINSNVTTLLGRVTGLPSVPPQLTGEQFDCLRKGLQLLNRLEDWILPDDFGAGEKFNAVEVGNLIRGCVEICKTKLGIDVSGPLVELTKQQFPGKGANPAERAKYYLSIVAVRMQILALLQGKADK